MNIQSMTFAQLIRFLKLSEELHFTRAAEKLGVAQPLLSEQIKSLEHMVGARLFDRTSRSVKLTEAGQIFTNRARLIVEGMKSAVVAATDAQRGKGARLRIGYTDEYTTGILPECVSGMKVIRPEANLELTLNMTPQLTQLLQTGLLDGVFLCPIPDEAFGDGFGLLSLPSLPLSIAVSRTHKLAENRKIAVAELKDEAFIEGPPSPQSASERIVNRLFSYHGIQRRIVQRASDQELSLSLVAQGMGVMVGSFPEHAKHREDIVIISMEDPHANLTRAFVWRKGQDLSLIPDLLDLLAGNSLESMN